MKKILIIAGGTGGHIFPALAVADVLRNQGHEIFWLGSDIGLEQTLVPSRFPLTCIRARRLRGKGWKAYLAAPWQLISSTLQAWRVIRRIKPQAALAMGGFVAGPGGLAAKLAGVPLIVHEQNAAAGYTNRLLAKLANQILVAYPGVFAGSSGAKVVGNPVRAEIRSLPVPEERFRNQGSLHILIFGGSQGAHALNQLMAQFVKDFPNSEQIEIWHQTGKTDYEEINHLYTQLPVRAKALAFIDDMAAAYGWADLVISRSGALTVAEIAAVGVASILVPFPAAVDNHQWHNALYLSEGGAAQIIAQNEITTSQLSVIINTFIQDRRLLLEKAQKARDLAKPQAAEAVAEVILQEITLRDGGS